MKRRHGEISLKKSEEKYRLLFDNMTNGLCYLKAIYDKDGRLIDCEYLDVNDKYLSFINRKSKKEILGKKVSQILPGTEQEWFDLFEPAPKKGQIVKFDLYNEPSDKWYSTTGFRPKGEQDTFVGIFDDITERKQTEEEKINAQKLAGEQKKLALVGQIAGKMAHDFNNILGIIMGNTELSLLECKEIETQKALKLIIEQTIRGKNLTKNLVAFAKDQEPSQEFFKFNEKIDLVVNLMKKDLHGINLLKEESMEIPELLADPGMIERTLVNLLQNSIHATGFSVNPQIIIRTYPLDNNICFEIEDNGCGIPSQQIESIFDPSFTLKGVRDTTGSYKTDVKGTGYGMTNVKKYIEQHKGNITVESELGSGTKFIITLPVINKELTSDEKIKIRKETSHFEKYILLVEDEPSLSNMQYRVLTQDPCNHKVDIANNGVIAIDLFNSNEYDFVSLDYVLPGRINGMDVYNHIRNVNEKIPILFLSGNMEFLESISALKQQDTNIDHLSKPCQNKDYVNGINKLLSKDIN